jgi:hypothetical protein
VRVAKVTKRSANETRREIPAVVMNGSSVAPRGEPSILSISGAGEKES